jgi:hypothetical protein
VTAMIFDTCVLNAKFAKLFPSPLTSNKAGVGHRLGSPRGHGGSFNDSESEDAGSEGSEGLHLAKSPRKSDLKKKGKTNSGKGNGCAAIM